MQNKGGTLAVRTRLLRLIAAFLLTMGVCGVLSFQTLFRLKVNGPVYNQIAQQKDLLADILPPPLYVLESYFTALQMLGESDTNMLNAECSKLQSLKEDFTSRTEFWRKELNGSAVSRVIGEESYTPAAAFFETLEKELCRPFAGRTRRLPRRLLMASSKRFTSNTARRWTRPSTWPRRTARLWKRTPPWK